MSLCLIIDEMHREIGTVSRHYQLLIDNKHALLRQIDHKIIRAFGPSEKVDLLVLKDQTQSELNALKKDFTFEISKIRY